MTSNSNQLAALRQAHREAAKICDHKVEPIEGSTCACVKVYKLLTAEEKARKP